MQSVQAIDLYSAATIFLSEISDSQKQKRCLPQQVDRSSYVFTLCRAQEEQRYGAMGGAQYKFVPPDQCLQLRALSFLASLLTAARTA
jgi:hypothetical protein